jgi:hypothetical protein
MIKVENTYVYNIYPAIRSMRNALKSWGNSDTIQDRVNNGVGVRHYYDKETNKNLICVSFNGGIIEPKDMELAKRLISRGGDERKFLRTIHVNCDITNTRA